MKKSWLVTIIFTILLLAGGVSVVVMPRVVSYSQCSAIYKKYAQVDGVEATFIKDYRVDDTVCLDVTVLKAVDTAGWRMLEQEFGIPEPPAHLKKKFEQGVDIISTKLVDKNNYRNFVPPYSPDCEVVGTSFVTQTIALFHTKNKEDVHAVIHHVHIKSISQQK